MTYIKLTEQRHDAHGDDVGHTQTEAEERDDGHTETPHDERQVHVPPALVVHLKPVHN